MKGKRAILSVFLLAVASGAAAEVYLWPLHGSRRLSSSFSEYRSGHYHAGIDLRSFGAVGLPCLAVSDGCVSRIKISPSGYGKALYLELSDGNTAVYAHLDGFSAEIDSLLWHYRVGKGVSWCDITLEKGVFCYDVGDTLCWSGETGTIAPHLHFELRDRSQRPLNPLENFYSLPDRASPVISGIEIIPLGKGSIAEGSRFPVFRLFRASAADGYFIADTLQLDGRFGFAVSTWDEQGVSRYHMAPYSIEIFIDGESLYKIRNSAFSYTQSGEVDLEYDITGKGSSNRYTLLYKKDGNTRADRTGQGVIDSEGDSSGGIHLARGIHQCGISVIDASGNVSTGSFVFKMHKYPVVTVARVLEAAPEAIVSTADPDGGVVSGRLFESLDGGREFSELPLFPIGRFHKAVLSGAEDALYRFEAVDDEGAAVTEWFGTSTMKPEQDNAFCETVIGVTGDGVFLDIMTDRTAKSVLEVRKLSKGGATGLEVIRTAPERFRAIAENSILENGLNIFRITGNDYRGYPFASTEAFKIYILRSGAETEILLSDTLSAVLQAGPMTGRAAVAIGSPRMPAAPPAELKSVSSPFSIEFEEERFRRPLRLKCDTGRKTALFVWDEDKGWSCIGVPAMEDGAVDINISGTYIFLKDGLPPMIRFAALEDRYQGSGFFKPYICYLPVEESGSGIDAWSAEAYINGDRAVCEWDEFRKRVILPIPSFLSAGRVRLRMEISDRSGNRAVEEFGFMLK